MFYFDLRMNVYSKKDRLVEGISGRTENHRLQRREKAHESQVDQHREDCNQPDGKFRRRSEEFLDGFLAVRLLLTFGCLKRAKFIEEILTPGIKEYIKLTVTKGVLYLSLSHFLVNLTTMGRFSCSVV